MTRADIINELKNRGYNADEYLCVKNGIKMEGIIIHNGTSLEPVIYPDKILSKYDAGEISENELTETIINTYKIAIDMNVDHNVLFNDDYILKNIYIGLQKQSNQKDIIKRKSNDFDGIEEYMYIRLDNDCTTKVTDELLDINGIGEDRAWEYALENTISQATIKSMCEILSRLSGIEYNEEMEKDMMIPMYIVSNQDSYRGAACILNKKILSDFAEKFEVEKIIVLPSSVHEMIIIPFTDYITEMELNNLVRSVNISVVDEIDRLVDKAYILEV